MLAGYESVHTYVTDKEDLDKILSVLSAASYRERLYTDGVDAFANSLCIDIYQGDTSTYINVYPEGFAEVVIRNPEDGSYKYYYSEYGINYDELLTILTDIREEAWAK